MRGLCHSAAYLWLAARRDGPARAARRSAPRDPRWARRLWRPTRSSWCESVVPADRVPRRQVLPRPQRSRQPVEPAPGTRVRACAGRRTPWGSRSSRCLRSCRTTKPRPNRARRAPNPHRHTTWTPSSPTWVHEAHEVGEAVHLQRARPAEVPWVELDANDPRTPGAWRRLGPAGHPRDVSDHSLVRPWSRDRHRVPRSGRTRSGWPGSAATPIRRQHPGGWPWPGADRRASPPPVVRHGPGRGCGRDRRRGPWFGDRSSGFRVAAGRRRQRVSSPTGASSNAGIASAPRRPWGSRKAGR